MAPMYDYTFLQSDVDPNVLALDPPQGEERIRVTKTVAGCELEATFWRLGATVNQQHTFCEVQASVLNFGSLDRADKDTEAAEHIMAFLRSLSSGPEPPLPACLKLVTADSLAMWLQGVRALAGIRDGLAVYLAGPIGNFTRPWFEVPDRPWSLSGNAFEVFVDRSGSSSSSSSGTLSVRVPISTSGGVKKDTCITWSDGTLFHEHTDAQHDNFTNDNGRGNVLFTAVSVGLGMDTYKDLVFVPKGMGWTPLPCISVTSVPAMLAGLFINVPGMRSNCKLMFAFDMDKQRMVALVLTTRDVEPGEKLLMELPMMMTIS